MKRRLLNLLTALSLLLCVAVVVLWVRSHHVQDSVLKSIGDQRVYCLSAYRGTLLFKRNDLSYSEIALNYRKARWHSDPVIPELGDRDLGDGMDSIIWRKAGWLGFGIGQEEYFEGVIHAAVVPLWFIAMSCFLLPAARALAAVRRRVRHRRGACPACGYDLRATPGRCPECGAASDALRDSQ